MVGFCKRIYCISCFTLFFAISVQIEVLFCQETGLPFVRNYLPKEFDKPPQIFSVVEDSKGLLYFAANDGVLEYDGRNWNPIYAINKTTVYSLDIDSLDKVYVGSYDEIGYFQAGISGEKKYISLTSLIKDKSVGIGTVWNTKVLGNKVYFLTNGAIYEYMPETKPPIKRFLPKPGNEFIGLFVHQENAYAYESNRGLIRIGKDTTELQADFFNHKKFRGALSLSHDSILIPSQRSGIYIYNPLQKNTTDFALNEHDFLTDNILVSGTTLLNENIALISLQKGLLIVSKNGKTLQKLNENRFLISNSIYYSYKSRNQNLWLCMESGICNTESTTAWSYWNKNNGLSGIVSDIVRFEDRIYVTSTTGIYYLENNTFHILQENPPGMAWKLFKFQTHDNKQKLLAGTSAGLYEVVGKQAKLIWSEMEVTEMLSLSDNPTRIIIGSTDGLYSIKYQNGNWKPEGKWQGISGTVSKMVADNVGDLWVGIYFNGILRATPNFNSITKPLNLRLFTTKEGLPSVAEIYPFKIRDNLIFGTDKGIYKFNTQIVKFEPYCDFGDQFCNRTRDVLKVCEDVSGKIWFIPSQNKIVDIGYLHSGGKNQSEWFYKPFRRLPKMLITTFYTDKNNIVWLGGSDGLYRYDAKQDAKDYNARFYCLIRKVSSGKDSIKVDMNPDNYITRQKVLKYDEHNIRFEFAAPFFDDESKTKFSYILDGFNDNWSEWSTENNAVFTNLSEGEYIFRVKAKNIYDTESYEAIYKLRILAPWSRTWLAYLIYFLVLVMLAILFIRLFSQKLRRDKMRLERIIKQRTKEITQKNAELQEQKVAIEIQANELIVKNNQLIELDQFKEGMVGMIVHDLKNPLNTIINGSKESETRQVGKQMLNLVMNILDVQKFENTKITIHPKDYLLINSVKEALRQVRILFERKSISVKSSVPGNLVFRGDIELINRVFVNLLTNAIKYTPNNGEIIFDATDISAPDLPDGFLRISVTDNGPGIPNDKLNSIFDKFSDVVIKKSGGIRSSGLGLTFCKLVIEAHGGKIYVESEPTKGSVFWFILPKGNKKIRADEELETSEVAPQIESIVLLESDKEYLKTFAEKLKAHSIYEFSDIDEILQSIEIRTTGIESWKNAVENALKACNEVKFFELIDLQEPKFS